MARDVTPGIRSYNLRARCIDQFTVNMLDSSSLISPMLSTKELSQEQVQSRYHGMRECYSTACRIAVGLYSQKAGFHFDESVKEVARYQIPDKDKVNRWVASTFNAPDIYREFLSGREVVMVLWPAIWITEWKVPADIKYWREKHDAEHPPDYDQCYRDEKGVHHAVIASGVVLVEKDGGESPLDE
jgi:hypothetical protein